MRRMTARWRVVFVLAAALAAGGCASAALPPSLDDGQRALVESSRFPVRVAVEPFHWPAYSERLIASLRGTGLFDTVGRLGEVPEPDLVASVERPVYGTASLLPVVTIVTLGIVPTSLDEEWGEVFSLRAAEAGGRPVRVDFTYEGPSTLGWFALLRALSPRYTLKRPSKTRRYYDALALSIVERAEEIDALSE